VTDLPAEFKEIATICKATEVVIGSHIVIGVADARDLHSGLQVGRRFTTWIEERIEKYGFREGSDYEVSHLPNLGSGGKARGGEPIKVYCLTLDMAKELSMVENNEQGRRARRYFIWAENAARRLATGELMTSENRTIMGGIAKAVFEKGIATTNAKVDALAAGQREMKDSLAKAMAEIKAVTAGFDPQQGVVTDFKPMLDILKESGVGKRGKNFVRQCSDRMVRWCIARERTKFVRESRETRRRLFCVEAARDWLTQEGRR
jgi:anti-repressor protein